MVPKRGSCYCRLLRAFYAYIKMVVCPLKPSHYPTSLVHCLQPTMSFNFFITDYFNASLIALILETTLCCKHDRID